MPFLFASVALIIPKFEVATTNEYFAVVGYTYACLIFYIVGFRVVDFLIRSIGEGAALVCIAVLIVAACAISESPRPGAFSVVLLTRFVKRKQHKAPAPTPLT